MRRKDLVAVFLAGAVSIVTLPGVCAADSRTKVGVSFSFGDDGHHRGRSHYKHYRYYPRNYYQYRKIYFQPERRYYYYYDVYPDKVNYYDNERSVVSSNPAYIPITSIANMGAQGVPESVIIDEIRRTGSVYRLTSEVISYLKQNNVSDRVIDAMLQTARK